jgi:hypothetical protein
MVERCSTKTNFRHHVATGMATGSKQTLSGRNNFGGKPVRRQTMPEMESIGKNQLARDRFDKTPFRTNFTKFHYG